MLYRGKVVLLYDVMWVFLYMAWTKSVRKNTGTAASMTRRRLERLALAGRGM
jgi:hypothetical protein